MVAPTWDTASQVLRGGSYCRHELWARWGITSCTIVMGRGIGEALPPSSPELHKVADGGKPIQSLCGGYLLREHMALLSYWWITLSERQKWAARPPPAYSWPLSHLWIICTLKRWLHHRQPLSLEEIIIFVNHTLQMVAPPPAKTRECAFLENLLLYSPILTCSDWKCVLPDLNSDCKECRWIVLLLPN